MIQQTPVLTVEIFSLIVIVSESVCKSLSICVLIFMDSCVLQRFYCIAVGFNFKLSSTSFRAKQISKFYSYIKVYLIFYTCVQCVIAFHIYLFMPKKESICLIFYIPTGVYSISIQDRPLMTYKRQIYMESKHCKLTSIHCYSRIMQSLFGVIA